MAADTRNGQRRRGQDRDPPARHRGGWLSKIGGLGLAPPAPKGDADRPGAFSRELQAPGGGHGKTGDLADDGAQPAMSEAFLHAGEDRLVVACLDVDHAIRRQSCLRERRREEIRACDTPQDLARRPRGDAAGEQGGGRTVDGTKSAARNFMKSATRQASARESRVDLGNSERKHRFRAQGSTLDLLDLRAQRLYGGLRPQAGP